VKRLLLPVLVIRHVCLGFAALFLVPAAVRADDWAPNLTLSGTWNDNASNADRAEDRLSAWQIQADVLASQRYTLRGADSLHLSFHAAAEWWPQYNNLSGAAVGGRAAWEHKFGLGALAPVFSAELAGDFVDAHEDGRRGTTGGVTLALRKRFNNVWRGSITEEFNELYARQAVYDRAGAQTTVEVARELDEVARLTFAVFYRDGDVLSYATPPRPDLVTVAPDRMPVTTFDRDFVAYSIKAATVGARVAYIRAVTEESAVILSYEYRHTERSPLRYVNQLVSLALVRQF
jgi:hypothetical protein